MFDRKYGALTANSRSHRAKSSSMRFRSDEERGYSAAFRCYLHFDKQHLYRQTPMAARCEEHYDGDSQHHEAAPRG